MVSLDELIIHSQHGPDREERLPDYLPDGTQGQQHPTQEHYCNSGTIPCDHGRRQNYIKMFDIQYTVRIQIFDFRGAVKKSLRKAGKTYCP